MKRNPNGQQAGWKSGPWIDYYLDSATGSCAALIPHREDGWTVRQFGPVRLWDDIENAITTWRKAGSPGIDRFRIHTDGHRQTVSLDTGNGPISWTLQPGQ